MKMQVVHGAVTVTSQEPAQLDVFPEHGVEVEVQDRTGGKVVYVHVDGITVLRTNITSRGRITLPTGTVLEWGTWEDEKAPPR